MTSQGEGNRTATQAYREQMDAARSNLKAISDAVKKHRSESDCKVDWSHVGDLAHLNEYLDSARRFIRQEEE